jgi:ubiquitin-protein ligase
MESQITTLKINYKDLQIELVKSSIDEKTHMYVVRGSFPEKSIINELLLDLDKEATNEQAINVVKSYLSKTRGKEVIAPNENKVSQTVAAGKSKDLPKTVEKKSNDILNLMMFDPYPWLKLATDVKSPENNKLCKLKNDDSDDELYEEYNSDNDKDKKNNIKQLNNDDIEFHELRQRWTLKQNNIKKPIDQQHLTEHSSKRKTKGSKHIVSKDINNSSNFGHELIINEIISLIKEQRKHNTIIEVIDDDVYNIIVKLKGFTNKNLTECLQKINKQKKYDWIEFTLNLNKDLYPFYPPIINFTKPRFDTSIFYKISNLRMLRLKYWSPARTLSYIIDNIRKIIDMHVSVDMNVELKSDGNSYLKIETALMNINFDSLEILDDLDTTQYPIVNINTIKQNSNKEPDSKKKSSSKSKNNYFTPGTGYGGSGSAVWDIKTFLKAQEEKDKNIMTNLSTFYKAFVDDMTAGYADRCYNVLQYSPFVLYIREQLKGISLLEMNKRIKVYNIILDILELIINNNKIINILYHRVQDYAIMDSITELHKEFSILSSIKKDSENPIINKITKFYTVAIKYNPKKENGIMLLENKSENKYEQYYNHMKKYGIREFNVESHGFCFKLTKKVSGVKNIMEEIANIAKNTPIARDSSIFVAFDPKKLTSFVALIMGPKDTPYSSGCFEFNIQLPENYPQSPPKVHIVTTGNGKVSFNPNLYAEGKVCLSLLGTWRGEPGESWNPEISTIQQVLISIQSLILVGEPWFNEPGYEANMGTAYGITESKRYNNRVRLDTMKYAILEQMTKPKPLWKNVTNDHFYLKKDEVLEVCQKWVDEATDNKSDYQSTFNKIKDALGKLTLANNSNNDDDSDND